jgi:hypothetical protein
MYIHVRKNLRAQMFSSPLVSSLVLSSLLLSSLLFFSLLSTLDLLSAPDSSFQSPPFFCFIFPSVGGLTFKLPERQALVWRSTS